MRRVSGAALWDAMGEELSAGANRALRSQLSPLQVEMASFLAVVFDGGCEKA
jgi:hypothetical protein